MTINEFKYWLEGYEESFQNGRPSDLQWRKIKERLNEAMVIKPITRTSNEILVGKPLTPDFPHKVTY